jgi:tRNA threonylcarbamoyladenosine modification (KEOPS) complex  Pcc1 subunit
MWLTKGVRNSVQWLQIRDDVLQGKAFGSVNKGAKEIKERNRSRIELVNSSNLIQLHQDALDDSEMRHSANTGGACTDVNTRSRFTKSC